MRLGARLTVGAGATLAGTLAFAGAAHAEGNNYTVTNLDIDGPGSFRDAVDQANDSPGFDRVLFQSGLTGSIDIGDAVYISDSVKIEGPGAGKLALDGGGDQRLLYMNGQNYAQLPNVTISGLTLENGAYSTGGAVYAVFADLTIANSVLSGNQGDRGGAVYSSYGSVRLVDSDFKDNDAYVAGGAVFGNFGTRLSVIDSTFEGNRAGYGSEYGSGGAIAAGGTSLNVSGSTFADNSSKISGGAIIGGGPPYVTTNISVENSTFTGNRGGQAFGAIGGSAYGFGNVSMDIDSSTISGNSADQVGGGIGGAIYSGSIDNSIVSGNRAAQGPDIFTPDPDDVEVPAGITRAGPGSGFTIDTSFDLIGSTSGAVLNETVAGSNLIGADPGLGALADNGGPTETMAVGSTSPVVNQGSTRLDLDQRNRTRPVAYPGVADSKAAGANGADIGAFELQAPPPTPPSPPTPPPPPPTPTPPPATDFHFGKLKLNKKRGTARLKVRVSGAGKVILRGSKKVKYAKKTINSKGSLWLPVKSKGWAKRHLKKKGHVKVVARVKFVPDAGKKRTKNKTVKLIKRKHRVKKRGAK